jgi:hypothetical protein
MPETEFEVIKESDDMPTKYSVGADVDENLLVLAASYNDVLGTVQMNRIDVGKPEIQRALIKLGWTPPKKGEK